jgi:small subunit ribosomal protein S20
MAKRHHSAVRQQRRSVRRNQINKKNKSALRTEVKRVRELVAQKDTASAQKALTKACSAIDRTVKKGTIHANTGARYKSRLTRQVAVLNSPPAK